MLSWFLFEAYRLELLRLRLEEAHRAVFLAS
jgi:hypothetical protein